MPSLVSALAVKLYTGCGKPGGTSNETMVGLFLLSVFLQLLSTADDAKTNKMITDIVKQYFKFLIVEPKLQNKKLDAC